MTKLENIGGRIRVAIVGPTLRYTGGQSVQADLLMRLWKSDPNIEAVFVAIDPPLPSFLQKAKEFRGLRTLLRQPFYLVNLWRAFAGVDVAHIFASSYWSFLISAVPAWCIGTMRGAKTLLNYHSGDSRDHLVRFRSAKFIMSRSERVVVPTPYLVDVLREFGVHATVVPNVVDVSQFRFRLRQPLRPYLICPRGFLPYYRVDVVVRAFAEIKKVYPDARLDLVGGGKLEGEIRHLVTVLNLRDVRFTGLASRQQIGDYYDQADIFINASSVDAMPVSVIEAFRAGTPVVTSSPEAMPYLVDHGRTGLLSLVGDEKALAANVIRLLRDEELAVHIAQNAYKESENYEWAMVRDQWLKAYRGIIACYVPKAVQGRGSAREPS